jgi:hypothetical protein
MKILLFFLLNLLLHNQVFALSNQEKLLFWQQVRKGSNMFNRLIDANDIKAAKEIKIEFINLAIEKFPTTEKDFLIGDTNNYHGLISEDLETLKKILDLFEEEKMPVVLNIYSLPGARYSSNIASELKLWDFEKYQRESLKFWKDLSLALKDHPAIVGYNILNQPNIRINSDDNIEEQRMLYNFYQEIASAIRANDKNITIILDSIGGRPEFFDGFIKQEIPNIMYSLHIEEPIQYTYYALNRGRFSYPGKILENDWNKETLRKSLNVIKKFQEKNKIPNNEIIVSSFGCHRMASGVENYLYDLAELFKEFGWHSAFYSFRSDINYDNDYELGDQKLPWSFYQAKESDLNPTPDRNQNNKIFKVIAEYLSN